MAAALCLMLLLLQDELLTKIIIHSIKDVAVETNRISADGNPTLYTSVVVPGGLPRAIPFSATPKSIQKDKTEQIKYNI
jgi:hypothetical protein